MALFNEYVRAGNDFAISVVTDINHVSSLKLITRTSVDKMKSGGLI